MVELIPVGSVAGAAPSEEPAAAPGALPSGPHAGGAPAAAPVAQHAGRDITGTAADVIVEGVEELVRAVVAASAGEQDRHEHDRYWQDGYWGTYFGVDPDTRRVVGTCGYRGAPRGGRVEVAFWTFPPFEGHGWATAMARALVERALADPRVEVVLAHTLPERAPATSVLTAAGLRLTDAVRRDERSGPGSTTVRGRVWRWERRRRG